jgi:hypothetical protein
LPQNFKSELLIKELPEVDLPDGYVVQSMAQEGDIASRCKVQGLGSDHPDPSEWTTVPEYKQVQEAPVQSRSTLDRVRQFMLYEAYTWVCVTYDRDCHFGYTHHKEQKADPATRSETDDLSYALGQ